MSESLPPVGSMVRCKISGHLTGRVVAHHDSGRALWVQYDGDDATPEFRQTREVVRVPTKPR